MNALGFIDIPKQNKMPRRCVFNGNKLERKTPNVVSLLACIRFQSGSRRNCRKGAYQKGGNHTMTLLHLGGSHVVKRADDIIG